MTALTLRSTFRLALRQTEGLIASTIGLLGLDLAVPDHSTLSRRAETLQVIPRPRSGTKPVHLLVDRTDLKLCIAGSSPKSNAASSPIQPIPWGAAMPNSAK